MKTRRAFASRLSAQEQASRFIARAPEISLTGMMEILVSSALTPALSPGRGCAEDTIDPGKSSVAPVALSNAARDLTTTTPTIALPLLGERAGVRTGRPSTIKWCKHGQPSARGFTLVEIAIALGVIGFALVAIIGILPVGLQIQRDNRAETIINQDGTFWMEAIRNGARGLDELTNNVESIEIKFYDYSTVPPTLVAPPAAYSQPFTHGNGPFGYTTGSNIIGLLTTPARFANTEAHAVVSAISGAAAEKSSSAADRELAFRYRMTVEIVRPGNNAPSFSALSANAIPTHPVDPLESLYELRLNMSYNWVRDTQPGIRKQTYRSTISRNVLAITYPPGGTTNFFFVH